MKRIKTSLFLISLLISANSFSQNKEENSVLKNEKLKQETQILFVDKDYNFPIVDAKITIKELGQELYTDQNGRLTLYNLPSKDLTLIVEHGDYVTQEFTLNLFDRDIIINLAANNLNLDEVVVIGEERNTNGTTSTVINRKAIEHLQATSLQEILQLVPGNTVTNPNFSNTNQANIRQYSADKFGSLGTSIIINGANLSNNANLQAINTATAGSGASFSSSSGGGTDLRAITADNIESVEVLRGIPSVEYGDLNSGSIIVQTKARKEPLQLKARFNPTVTQFWAGKGFDLKGNNGTLYADFDYTKSNDKETNKYQNYTRFSGTLQYTNKFGKKKNWRSNSTLAFSYSRDLYDLDPDFVIDSAKNDAKERYIRFSTNGIIDFDKKFSRTFKYNAAVNYGIQNGFQQQYYTADITAESHALTNSTNTVEYLPSSYLSKMWVNGKPLTISAKISNQFYFFTGNINHSILVGADWNMDANFGAGKSFTRPPRNTSGSAFRARAFNQIPALHQIGAYIQDHLSTTIGESKLNIIGGLRYDFIQPFDGDYSLNALSPRLNFSYKTPIGFTFRGGYGITAKAPTLLYLYPENAFFDFYSLNHYTQNPDERLAMISTRVYNTENHALKLSKTNKTELGLDYEWGINQKKRLSVTAYYEHTKNGYSMSTSLNSVKFSNYPIYSIVGQPNGQQPILSNDINYSTRLVSYNTPTNNINRTNKGVEFELDLGKFKPINTTFNINGAYTSTRSVANNNYILQQNVADRETTRIGVFSPGRGNVNERFITTLRAIHHIPDLSFIITLSAQTIWQDQNKYVGYESIPIGYIPYLKDGGNPSVIYFTEQERQSINNINDPDLYLSINEETFKTEKWKPLWLFNLKLTKEFKSGLNFSFFANNFINYRPLETSTRYPTIYYKRNIEFFFGSEISIKL